MKYNMKTFKQYNESLRDQMKPKSEDEIYSNLTDEEKMEYYKLKDFQDFFVNKWNGDFKIDRKNYTPTVSRISLSIKTDLFYVVISCLDEDKYEIYFESLVGNTALEDLELKTKENILEWVEKEVKNDVEERLYHIKNSIVDLESEQAKIELDYKKYKK
jgi:hypothetical protein